MIEPLPDGPRDWLRCAARCSPASDALVTPQGCYDWSALYSLAAGLSAGLRARGVSPGAIVVLQSRSAKLLALLLHVALLGDYVLLPLDPRLSAQCRRRLLDRARPELVLSGDDVRGLLAEVTGAGPDSARQDRVGGGDRRPRLLIATSGSGAAPELIELSDRNLAASVTAANTCLGLSRSSRWLVCLPLVHIGGLAVLLRCAQVGAAVVLHEGFDAVAVSNGLQRQRVTHVSLVPAMLARLLELGVAPPASLEVALIGGAPLDPMLAQQALGAEWPLWLSYGMTETTAMLAARRLIADDTLGPLPVGPALPGVRLRVVDEQGQPAGHRVGVIEVSGAAVTGQAGMTAGGWLTTGDRGQLDARGCLTVLGRRDWLINSGGEKVQPERVEQELSRCPGIAEVAVTSRPDPVWGERVVAMYCGDIEQDALERWCRQALAGALRPRDFIRVVSLPRTANGKLDRVALREQARTEPAPDGAFAPSGTFGA